LVNPEHCLDSSFKCNVCFEGREFFGRGFFGGFPSEGAVRNRKDNDPANIAILPRCTLARRDTSLGSLSNKLKWTGWICAFLLSPIKKLAKVPV